MTFRRLSSTLGALALLALPLAACQQPVAVVAAPAPKAFMVFFDLGKSALTPRAKAIVMDAAATARSTAHTQIEVNGHADTTGAAKYNMTLSMARARNVASELVRGGVPAQEIAIKAFGDTVLLVPTGRNVREPQNRRVEIIIR